jgi:hypothetical protein
VLLQKQQINSLLKQGLGRGILFRREHFHLSHDFGFKVAAEEPAPVSGWPIEPIVPGNWRIRSQFGNGRRDRLRRGRGRNRGGSGID